MVEIRTREDLEEWLEDRPKNWAQVLSVRTALRGLPFGILARKGSEDYNEYCLALFRTLCMAWTSCSWPASGIQYSALLGVQSLVSVVGAFVHSKNYSYDASKDIAYATYTAGYYDFGVANPGDAAAAVADAAESFDQELSVANWQAVSADCNWLEKQKSPTKASQALARQSLWLGQPSQLWRAVLAHGMYTAPKPDLSFSVWIDWFEARIRGGSVAFDIPGDSNRIEDKKILFLLSEQTDEDFWDRGAYYVNTSLQRWLDEARARTAPLLDDVLHEVPEQDQSAVAYGFNQEGKVDRLPTSNQQHLRDQPDQRQIYADVREAFDELRAEGQRLGDTLANAVERMLRSMPEAFEDAQAYLVWRDGNRLRRLYLAHRAVAATLDPDPARLEPAIAEQLGGALDLFNLFAMGDDGLRAKDEATIPFQERASAETEAALARPVVTAMLQTPEIFTEAALGDIQASLNDDNLPKDDPYDAQARVQTNKTWRNVTAAMFAAVRNIVVRGSQSAGKEMAKGALNAMGGAAFTDLAGATKIYEPLMVFISTNASALSAYAATAFSNYRLDMLIDAVVRFFKRS